MARVSTRSRVCACVIDVLALFGAVLLAIFALSSIWPSEDSRSFLAPVQDHHITQAKPTSPRPAKNQDPLEKTFYDDPELSYSIEKPMKNWDAKRKEWLQRHPSYAAGAGDRILLITGSQPSPCKSRLGDHFLLRFLKNKVDYCRINGYDIFYINRFLHPKMDSYWSKIPTVRAAMIAHPEVEWIWWIDSDAVFTDMEFKIPMDRYQAHNLVIHGWTNVVYGEENGKSWTGLNAGVFLIRNCQWSMDLLDAWGKMGPWTLNYVKWGHILKSTFKDKSDSTSDDQSALTYLLFTERAKWGDKTYLEHEYYLQAYWIGVQGRLDNVTDRYNEIEDTASELRRRHAEKLSSWYGTLREGYLKKKGYRYTDDERRPFITHFTGCQPCSGDHNPIYKGDDCRVEMERALNFAENQVLRTYGFVHEDLLRPSVSPVPFDYPRNTGISSA